jgi:hypothetical protein
MYVRSAVASICNVAGAVSVMKTTPFYDWYLLDASDCGALQPPVIGYSLVDCLP